MKSQSGYVVVLDFKNGLLLFVWRSNTRLEFTTLRGAQKELERQASRLSVQGYAVGKVLDSAGQPVYTLVM